MDELEARIAELREQEELDAIRPPLDGRQVMEFLGVEPGPRRRRGARLPARGPPRRRPDRRGRRLRAPRRVGAAKGFCAAVDTAPEFKLPEYKGIAVTKGPPVTDDEIAKTIDGLREQQADFADVTRRCRPAIMS